MITSKTFGIIITFILLLQTVSALETLGLSRIDFSSNDQEVEGKAFLLYGIENGRVDEARATYDRLSAIDGTKSKESVSITSKLTNYKLQYPLINENIPVYRGEIKDKVPYIPFIRNEQWYNNWCSNLVDSNFYFVSKQIGFNSVYCVEFETIGLLGRLSSSPKTLFTDKITVTSTGQSKTVELSEKNQVDFIDGYLRARFVSMQGSLSGTPRPSIDYDIYFSSTTNKWNLISKPLSSQYRAFIKDNFVDISDFKAFCEKNGAVKCIEELNRKSTFPIVTYTDYENTIITEQQSGSLILSNTPIYEYPSFTLKIDADWVGIFEPVGKPKILDTRGDDFIEGSNGKLEIDIKNDADVKASFNIGIDCGSNWKVINQNNVPFAPKETKTLTYFVTSETESKACTTCSIIVKDSSNPSVKDTESQKICVKEANQCPNKGATRCNANIIQQCENVNGVQVWQTRETCRQGEICQNSKCVAEGQPPPPPECKPILKAGDVTILPNFSRECVGTLSLILIIASAIGGIFALIIMLGFTNPRIENKGLSFFLSAIVGILIGVLVYLTFWFGVLAFILLMVLWFVIPKPLRKGIKKGVKRFREE